jgi:hypothetical protein
MKRLRPRHAVKKLKGKLEGKTTKRVSRAVRLRVGAEVRDKQPKKTQTRRAGQG